MLTVPKGELERIKVHVIDTFVPNFTSKCFCVLLVREKKVGKHSYKV